MFLKDFLISPILILIVLLVAWRLSKRYCDPLTKPYFLPALAIKIVGAISLGLIYQYYYAGGDTFAYHTHGSKIIWEAFVKDPLTGIKLFLADGIHQGDFYKYSSRIWYFRDPQSYWVIRTSFIFDILTFGTYSATAVFFAFISFSGSWVLFKTFYRRYPEAHLFLAISIFFIPSVVFWSSGILKDTLTLSAIGWVIYSFDKVIVRRKFSVASLTALAISMTAIYFIKIFILLILIPALIIWYFSENLVSVRKFALKILIAPLVLAVCLTFIYVAANNITKNDPRYALNKIAKTAQVTAYDIRYWTGKDAGSGYSLGELDGSINSLLRIAPKGLVVTYFRPFLWEVNNPLMLLGSLEGIFLFVLIIYVLIKSKFSGIRRAFSKNPILLFCFIFSVGYAIAVGVSTYNFGTLSRYKVPCIPFLLIGLAILSSQSKREKNLTLWDSTE